MKMTIVEALMVISSVFVLPALAVITFSFFSGGLRNTERAKFQVLSEPDEIDYWAEEPGASAGSGRETEESAGSVRRGEVLIHEA
jgi:hypothetical protein